MKKINPKTHRIPHYFSKYFHKKAILVLCILGFPVYISAQSIDMGLQGALASAWLLNGNVLSGKDNQGYRFSLSYNYGLHGAINISHGYGIELEILSGTLSQSYGGVFNGGGSFPGNGITYYPSETYSANTELSVYKIPVMFRYEHELSGKYLEAGLAYEIISSASFVASYKGGITPDESNDVSKQFPAGNFLAIVGFGWNKHFTRESNFYFHAGFRFEYGLFDLQGIDGHGQDLTGAKSVVLYPPWPNSYYHGYHSTHSLEASFNIGIFYRFYPKAMMHKRVVDF